MSESKRVTVAFKNGKQLKLRIELLQEHHLDQAIEVLADLMAGYEPVSTNLGLGKDDWKEFARLYCEKAAKERSSHVAIRETTGKVCSLTIAEDIKSNQPGMSQLSNPNWGRVLEFVDKVEEDAWPSEHWRKGKVWHHFLSGTHPDYRGAGINPRVNRENIAYAQKLGYEKVIVEATSVQNQTATKKLGFKVDHEAPYRHSQNNEGKYVFKEFDDSVHFSCQACSLPLAQDEILGPALCNCQFSTGEQ